jgi:hypothetical protein
MAVHGRLLQHASPERCVRRNALLFPLFWKTSSSSSSCGHHRCHRRCCRRPSSPSFVPFPSPCFEKYLNEQKVSPLFCVYCCPVLLEKTRKGCVWFGYSACLSPHAAGACVCGLECGAGSCTVRVLHIGLSHHRDPALEVLQRVAHREGGSLFKPSFVK